MSDTLTLERAAERLLEDEGLRRDLTDDEAQPLLDWALAQLQAAAAARASLPDVLERTRATAHEVNNLLAVAGDGDTAALAGRLRELAGRPRPRSAGLWERRQRPGDPLDTLARRLPSLTGPDRVRAVLALLPTAQPETRP